VDTHIERIKKADLLLKQKKIAIKNGMKRILICNYKRRRSGVLNIIYPTRAAFRKSRAKTLEGLKAPQYLTHL
jgi:hypothetical protein